MVWHLVLIDMGVAVRKGVPKADITVGRLSSQGFSSLIL
jgi:hypothetical protein